MPVESNPPSGNQKQLLVTFDYELFLGNRSGSVDECMITPTNKLVILLGKYIITMEDLL